MVAARGGIEASELFRSPGALFLLGKQRSFVGQTRRPQASGSGSERRVDAVRPTAEHGRQLVAVDRGHAGRPDERSRPRRPVRGGDAEALVGEQHDAGLHRLRARPVVWVLYGFNMGFGNPWHGLSDSGFFGNFIGQPGAVLNHASEQGVGNIPLWLRTRPARRLPAVLARLLPVRVRGDHADPDARLGPRPRQLQGLDPVRRPLGDLRLHRQRVPDLGRRLVRAEGRGRLLRRLRHPSLGRRLRLRRRLGDRATACPRPRDRRAEQPG